VGLSVHSPTGFIAMQDTGLIDISHCFLIPLFKDSRQTMPHLNQATLGHFELEMKIKYRQNLRDRYPKAVM
jgi:hypothetical protein